MLARILALLRSPFSVIQTHRSLALENLALRQQLFVLTLTKDSPSGREVQGVGQGKVVAFPRVG